MKEYNLFASVYDDMMDRIPYEEWEQYLLVQMCSLGVPPCGRITELGCGTGTMTQLLAEEGFIMTGIDMSVDMLKIAESKAEEQEKAERSEAEQPEAERSEAKQSEESTFEMTAPEYICGDMRDFSLQEKQDAVISVGDSMNYLLSEEDLMKTFISVKKCLKPGGVFIFDLKTDYFFTHVLDGRTYRDRYHNFLCTWKNIYNNQDRIHEYHLKFKSRIKELNGYREVHRQRAFTAEEIVSAARQAGFTRGRAYSAFTFEKPKKNSERWYIVLMN